MIIGCTNISSTSQDLTNNSIINSTVNNISNLPENSINQNNSLEIFTQNETKINSYDVEKTFSFFNKTPNKDEILILKMNLNNSECGLRKLTTAILYKYDQISDDKFYEEFSIKDYAKRQNGEYNYVESDFITKELETIENKFPNYENNLILFYAFCELKDKNYWVITTKGKLGIARFMRSAALVIMEPQIDIVPLQNELDQRTQKEELG
jgi:hypothetical protein